MVNKKLQIWLPLLFSLVLILGMFLGNKLSKYNNNGKFLAKNRNTTLQEALEIIRQKYVDTVNIDSLQNVQLQNLVHSLDPHSNYLLPVEMQEAVEDLAGEFVGIGIEFYVLQDTVVVSQIKAQGPAEKAGLLLGDKILSINNVPITKPTSTDSIKNKFRGGRKTSAELKIQRAGKIIPITVIRDYIPVTPLDASYMANAKTGYLKLSKFSETSYESIIQAIEDLKKNGMSSLVLDLRNNGGGFLTEAIDIIDEFLDGEKLVVYTEGANSKKMEYRCKRPGQFENGKLIVLVDEFSASASEVVAGALQDWERATIIGRRSFGKGLVQEDFGLKNGASVRLTTARYYTPLGRNIQKPYSNGFGAYNNEINERYHNGELLQKDSLKQATEKVFNTKNGHKVYGGGGIMPDIFVAFDSAILNQRLSQIAQSEAFYLFAFNWYLSHVQEVKVHNSPTSFYNFYQSNNLIWSDYLQSKNVNLSIINSLNAHSTQLIKNSLLGQIAFFKWSKNAYYEIINKEDNMMKKALEQISKN